MLVCPLFLPLPPTFPEPQRSGLRQGQSLPEVRGPWKSSPFFIWSRPPVAMVTQHLLPNSALAVTWAWHPPSCCWFCVLPNVLLCSLRNASPFFRGGGGTHLFKRHGDKGGSIYAHCNLRKPALACVGPLTLPVFGLMFCICRSQILLQTPLLDLFY